MVIYILYNNINIFNIKTNNLYMECIYLYFKASGSYMYNDFLDRGFQLTRNLLNRGFLVVKLTLKLSLRKFYGRHHDLVNSG